MSAHPVAYRGGRGEPSLFPVAVLTAWTALAGTGVYLYVATGDRGAVLAGLVALAGVMLLAAAHAVVAPSKSSAAASGAVALVSALAMTAILLPSSGSLLVDAIVLLGAAVGGATLFVRSVDLPSLGRPRLRESSLLLVILLPIALAFAEAAALGLRFWESFPLGASSYLFVPFLALWGFAEEALFRGVVQRAFHGIMGPLGAIATAALLNAVLMLFWGSVMYALFAFLAGMVLGALYWRSRSLMYVGTVRALMDTWLIIAFLAMGVVSA